MATWTATNNTVTLTLTVNETGTSVSANTSTVSWQLSLTATAGYFTNRSVSWNVNIGGITRSEVSTVTASQGQTIVLGSGTGSISHDSNGTKTITCTGHVERSGTWSTSWTALNISQSLTLTNIARYATPSVTPSSVVCSGQSSDRFSIAFTYASSAYYYLLTVTIPNVTELYRTTLHGTAGATAVVLWAPERNTVQYFASTETTHTVQFNLVTYTDSTMTTTVGQTAVQATLKASQTYHAPTLTIASYSITENTASLVAASLADSTVVEYLSSKSISIPASANYGASISSVKITNGSQTATMTGSGGTYSKTMTNLTAGSFKIVATDSRGFTATTTQTGTLVHYCMPTILAEVSRVQPTDPDIAAKLKGVVWKGTIGNTSTSFSVSYKYKEKGASTWTDSVNTLTWTESGSGKIDYDEDFQLAEEFAYNKQYQIQFTLTDGFSTVTSSEQTIFVGIPVFSWGEDHFDVYGDFHIHDRTDPDTVYSVMKAGEKAVKVTQTTYTTSSLTGGSDNTITLTMPTGATEVLAIIPHRITPVSTWATLGYLGAVSLTNHTVAVHTIGSNSQTYVIGYVVLWR